MSFSVSLDELAHKRGSRIFPTCGPTSMIPTGDWSYAVRIGESDMLGPKKIHSGYAWSYTLVMVGAVWWKNKDSYILD